MLPQQTGDRSFVGDTKMSPNTGGISLRKSSLELTGEEQLQLVNLEAGFVCTVIDTPCQRFLEGDGFHPGNEISQYPYCFANHSKWRVLFSTTETTK